MQWIGHWAGGALVVCVLAGAGACGGSSSNDGDDATSDSGSDSTSGGSGGSSSGSGDDGSSNGSGDDGSSNGSGSTGLVMGDPTPVEDYFGQAAAMVCEWLTPCCGALELPISESDCSTAIEARFAADYASADPDNFTYDPDLGGDCLATARELYRELSCELEGSPGMDIDPSVNEVCDHVFVGKLEPGAPCTADIECASQPGDEPDCKSLGSSDATVCVVERRATEGEACYWTCTEEAGATFCSGLAGDAPALQGRCYTNDQLYCADGSCAKQPALGETCGANAFCAGGYCLDGICSPAGDSGDPCQVDSECTEDLYCDVTACAPKKADGDTCDYENECQSKSCDEGVCGAVSDGNFAIALLCSLASGQP